MPGLLINTSSCKGSSKSSSVSSSASTSPTSSYTISFLPPSPSRKHTPTPSPRPTIHSRRTLSYTLTRRSSPIRRVPPPILPGLGISISPITSSLTSSSHTNFDINISIQEIPEDEVMQEGPTGLELQIPRSSDSDIEVWSRMLALQREYHCYNSARLEAAVEALEMGWASGDGRGEIGIPSRLCLDLLNEELRGKMRGKMRGWC